ncbi:MAG: bifunctional glutamate N-acetyltransferase/amino-acid acetyltransferase ArgJ [Actinobacteria bacterium]|nr:bifunctional glutamate N-acetyltransferase/amino-acid acetyltransferase ArgJ [Actinomycetota bacterium]
MSVTAARGFVANGVRAGIRRSGLDLALVRSLPAAVGGAVWTTNRVQAAPVTVSRRHLEVAEPQAVVVNSGVANAATGERGISDANDTALEVAAALGIRAEEVIVLSTGVIGVPLPLDKVRCGVREAAKSLGADGSSAAAEAILTTDRGSKQSSVVGAGFTVGGMAKGAGMIHPRLATMLAVVTTDFPLEPGEAGPLLRTAADATFNCISVDGECSTNDAVVLLANGASELSRDSAADEAFAAALHGVCADLARQIVADGEGSTVLLEITVSGAVSDDEATAVARRIATSPLVKTAAFGHDPNWGRVLAAAGSAPWNGGFARLQPELLSVAFDGTRVFERGAPTGLSPELTGAAVSIDLDLGLGAGSAAYLASDLTYDYVRLNAEYTT